MLSVPAFIRLAIVQQSAALERDWGIGKKQQLLHSFAACVFCLSDKIRKRLFIHNEICPLFHYLRNDYCIMSCFSCPSFTVHIISAIYYKIKNRSSHGNNYFKLRVWNLVFLHFDDMRVADCKKLAESPKGDFRQAHASDANRRGFCNYSDLGSECILTRLIEELRPCTNSKILPKFKNIAWFVWSSIGDILTIDSAEIAIRIQFDSNLLTIICC